MMANSLAPAEGLASAFATPEAAAVRQLPKRKTLSRIALSVPLLLSNRIRSGVCAVLCVWPSLGPRKSMFRKHRADGVQCPRRRPTPRESLIHVLRITLRLGLKSCFQAPPLLRLCPIMDTTSDSEIQIAGSCATGTALSPVATVPGQASSKRSRHGVETCTGRFSISTGDWSWPDNQSIG